PPRGAGAGVRPVPPRRGRNGQGAGGDRSGSVHRQATGRSDGRPDLARLESRPRIDVLVQPAPGHLGAGPSARGGRDPRTGAGQGLTPGGGSPERVIGRRRFGAPGASRTTVGYPPSTPNGRGACVRALLIASRKKRSTPCRDGC